jgi:hypothetical protein
MSTVDVPALEHALHKRRINDLIYEGLHARPRDEAIGFFCECQSSSCFTTVWVTGGQYAASRGRPRWALLAHGHGRARHAV